MIAKDISQQDEGRAMLRKSAALKKSSLVQLGSPDRWYCTALMIEAKQKGSTIFLYFAEWLKVYLSSIHPGPLPMSMGIVSEKTA